MTLLLVDQFSFFMVYQFWQDLNYFKVTYHNLALEGSLGVFLEAKQDVVITF